MGRDAREQAEGSRHHVTVRGTGGRAIFRSRDDRFAFLSRLANVTAVSHWALLDYCLMTNHVHLLLELGRRGMADGMQMLLTGHAHRFNAVHEERGHVFQGRYYSKLIRTEEHLFSTFRYIAHNPCAAGLARTPADWRWSAYRALAGLSRPLGGLDRDTAYKYVGGVDGYRALTESAPPSILELVAPGTPAAMRRALDHGYTQRDIAGALGVGQSTVHRRLRESGVPGTVDSHQRTLRRGEAAGESPVPGTPDS